MAKIDPKTVAHVAIHITPVAKAMKMETDQWAQAVHMRSVAMWWIKEAGIKDPKVAAALIAKWEESPSGYGCNCSQYNQAGGKPTATQAVAVDLAEFLKDVK